MQAYIGSLHCYPLKSGRGLTLDQALLTAAGLEHDRRWMVVGAGGRFRSQREWPRLTLIHAQPDEQQLRLQARGMPSLALPLQRAGERVPVSIWRHHCEALDEGDVPAAWLQELLGEPCRLVRFDPAHRRLSSRDWTGQWEAENRFSDAFPLLIISSASLADLNARLPKPLTMERFRPNIVLEGLQAYDEDRIDELQIGAVRLKLVKPCTRCRIPSIDPETALSDGEEPLRTLHTYRYDAALQGVCFGQNAIILQGAGSVLESGQTVQVSWRRDIRSAT